RGVSGEIAELPGGRRLVEQPYATARQRGEQVLTVRPGSAADDEQQTIGGDGAHSEASGERFTAGGRPVPAGREGAGRGAPGRCRRGGCVQAGAPRVGTLTVAVMCGPSRHRSVVSCCETDAPGSERWRVATGNTDAARRE